MDDEDTELQWLAQQSLEERRKWEETQWRAIAEGPGFEWLKKSIERRYGRSDSKTS